MSKAVPVVANLWRKRWESDLEKRIAILPPDVNVEIIGRAPVSDGIFVHLSTLEWDESKEVFPDALRCTPEIDSSVMAVLDYISSIVDARSIELRPPAA